MKNIFRQKIHALLIVGYQFKGMLNINEYFQRFPVDYMKLFRKRLLIDLCKYFKRHKKCTRQRYCNKYGQSPNNDRRHRPSELDIQVPGPRQFVRGVVGYVVHMRGPCAFSQLDGFECRTTTPSVHCASLSSPSMQIGSFATIAGLVGGWAVGGCVHALGSRRRGDRTGQDRTGQDRRLGCGRFALAQ